MKNKATLKHYAEALFSIGKEEGKIDLYEKDLSFLTAVLVKNSEFIKFLSSPMIEKEIKEKVIDDCFQNNISVAVIGFLKVMIKRKVIRYISDIDEAYEHLCHQYHGILEGRIYTPYKLSEAKVKEIEEIFSSRLQQKVVLKTILDSHLLAGMKIYLNDTLYDYSLDSKLNKIRDGLLQEK